jgi:hypothetical protein
VVALFRARSADDNVRVAILISFCQGFLDLPFALMSLICCVSAVQTVGMIKDVRAKRARCARRRLILRPAAVLLAGGGRHQFKTANCAAVYGACLHNSRARIVASVVISHLPNQRPPRWRRLGRLVAAAAGKQPQPHAASSSRAAWFKRNMSTLQLHPM